MWGCEIMSEYPLGYGKLLIYGGDLPVISWTEYNAEMGWIVIIYERSGKSIDLWPTFYIYSSASRWQMYETENKKRHFKSILFFSAQTFVCFKFSKRLPCKCITLLLRGNAKWRNRTERSGGTEEGDVSAGWCGWLAGWHCRMTWIINDCRRTMLALLY